MDAQPFLFAISGVKNSGKTTLITKLLPIFTGYGLKAATIKHDGHDFQADVPGTDTHAHLAAGAYGTAVFSAEKYMVVKKEPVTEEALAALFPEADLILLEGFKHSHYPKLEVVRAGNENGKGALVCSGGSLAAVAADGILAGSVPEHIPILDLNDPNAVAEFILDYWFIRTRLSLAVLSGGKSVRMGRDKADLPFKGKTFLQNRIDVGRALGIDDVLISGYRGSDCNERVVEDRFPGRGPLAGMEAAFAASSREFTLVVTVDMPLVDEAVLLGLIRAYRRAYLAKENKPVLILQHGGRTEPLLGIYASHLSWQIEEILNTGRGVVFRLLDLCGYEVFQSPAPEECFLNINDQEAYGRITGALKEGAGGEGREKGAKG